MKKLRLLLTPRCNRNCEGCCNNDFDLENLPVVTDEELSDYDLIMLTGGEPLLDLDRLDHWIRKIRKASKKVEVVLYTAFVSNPWLPSYMKQLDGVTITLHEQRDVLSFELLCIAMENIARAERGMFPKKTWRVNVFSGVSLKTPLSESWQGKFGIEWVKDCPLPEGEVFKRVPEAFG